MADRVVVVGYARTPFGRFGGALRDWPIPRLGAVAVRGALAHADVGPDDVDELVQGTNFPGADRSIARQTALHAGLPEDRVSYTVDQACCSSLTAITMAARSIRLGEAGIAVAGGADNLSRVPYYLERERWGARLGDVHLVDQLVIACPFTGERRAVQAGREAVSHGIGREEQDAWALRSQERFAAARAHGYVDDELAPVPADADAGLGGLDEDECPRPDTTQDRLAALPTVYDSPTVTSGTAPNLATGASAVVLTSTSAADSRGLAARAELLGWALVSGPPAAIASIPAVAARRALDRAGLTIDDIAVIEINEAFAAVPLVSTLVLADGDATRAEKLRAQTNVNGGALAVGHPTGATAARLLMAVIGELTRRGGGYGLVAICGGIGEAAAVVVKV